MSSLNVEGAYDIGLAYRKQFVLAERGHSVCAFAIYQKPHRWDQVLDDAETRERFDIGFM